ncbi:cytochrome P450 714C2-like [Humulus lupulus]|uniref:cytochrome P450 714C2-like n=1 Tax=Humulus lupulus TaxID=3486 RepID=UPI002B40DD3C|nr:cytochrome P450 714C2-like [Humulus lupulus]
MEIGKALLTFCLLGIFALVVRLYNVLVLKPKRLRSILRDQGIDGPPSNFLLGNIREIRKAQANSPTQLTQTHKLASFLFPFFDEWRTKFGDVFVFALGNIQILYVNESEAVRELTTCTSLDLGKPSYQHRERGPLLGQGILTSNGPVWAHQRKIIAPELYMDKVKGMVNMITESTITLMESWKSRIVEKESSGGGGVVNIKIDEDMRIFSGDVISRACFGSNFSEGQEIFYKLRKLQEAMARKCLATGIPGARYFPTKNNREAWALEKELKDLILKVVKQRVEASYEKDVLQMVLEGAQKSDLNGEEATDRFVVDNCKNIYLAGSETTAVSATWCLMLLATNPQWQQRVRSEVLDICRGHNPDSDMLRKMKQLTMVIHETLRLYPPVTVVSREAFKDMKIGKIFVPKGVNVWTTVLTHHTDPQIWGPDSFEFNPERFSNGITGACKLPHLYMPFGVGPRICLGQNLAMVELKILLALLVSKFSFTLSPNYVHKPAIRLVIEPEHGVDLLVREL